MHELVLVIVLFLMEAQMILLWRTSTQKEGLSMVKSWRIVGFEHPKKEKSILYQQNISEETMIRLLKGAIKDGANLFSIRGFDKNE